MAEINIRKKRPVWPWIICVLILLGALVFYVYSSGRMIPNNDKDNIGPDEQTEPGMGINSGKINNSSERIVQWSSILTETVAV